MNPEWLKSTDPCPVMLLVRLFYPRFLFGVEENYNDFWGAEIDLSQRKIVVKMAHFVSLHVLRRRDLGET